MEKNPENRRRVKLYVLNASRHWDDRGTGHVSAIYSERLIGMSLIVRDEQSAAVLLESKIDMETSYQKQQETLIVWSENDADMALSFQEKAGCEEVWAKICQVQGKDPSVEVTQDNLDEDDEEEVGSSLGGYGAAGGEGVAGGGPAGQGSSMAGPLLPGCEMGKLEKIGEVVQGCMGHPHQRDKLATAIEQEDYIKKLLELFKKCEDMEYTEGLQQLFSIMKSILMLNRNALYEVLFSDECIEDVLGCLEWDPTGANPRRHRHYIRDIAKFKEVIPLENPELYAKIQQMYRVQYIQDVILPSPTLFDENNLNTLQSFIFFNKMEIVNLLQEDERFLKQLFAQLCSSETPVPKRRDAILFLKEFCQFSQTLQAMQREAFFRLLMNHGILQAIQGALDVDDQKTRSATVDVFTYIVEMHPFVVREFCMTQAAKEANDRNLFFVHIIRQAVVADPDPQASGAMQILTIMRLLLDPENMLNSPNKTEKTEFLSFFYKRCIQYLFEPISAITASGSLPKREDIRTVHILNLILEFLNYCVEHHTFHIKNFIIGRDVLKSVLVLLQSSHQFLVVAVIRFLRKIVGLNDDFYNRYIERGDLLKPVLDTFLRNGRRYNLLNSSILELFEFIRQEDVKRLIIYIIGRYWELLQPISFTQTFNSLHVRYGIHTNPSPEPIRTSLVDRPATPEVAESGIGKALMSRMNALSGAGNAKRFRRDERDLDQDEEQWFENDEAETPAASGSGDVEMESAPEGEDGEKLTALTSMKSLLGINTAPPVKRPNPDDGDDDDDSTFTGGAWKSTANRGSPRKVAVRSPSPSFKVSLASADSTRQLNTPPFTDTYTNGLLTSSPENHVSTSSAWQHDTINNNTNSDTPPKRVSPSPSPPPRLSPLNPSLKPASPSLVDYPDEDEEELPVAVSGESNGTAEEHSRRETPPEVAS
ncbi:serine/threonine-protein phosphatase 4 regulatory subunit 3A-like [Paramacrobiotus metropolitanus]|uniref:serine/threonine-protein phosphatase 4 regulatory subunit 3A-like n=1 Tax=Paramacrobiotus metropolitanus TaxID=2943436 RepID=UPI0024462F1F|nr:serine/threonine-protein phosphatase 4 regulatory subunit 3A-like [Paramacrobiotus metropolitanus]